MADIELVIKIPEEEYDFTKGAKTARTYNTEYYVNLILNGTPLPKGHGDLIDRDELLDSGCIWEFHRYDDYLKASKVIKNMPTIVEADKENK